MNLTGVVIYSRENPYAFSGYVDARCTSGFCTVKKKINSNCQKKVRHLNVLATDKSAKLVTFIGKGGAGKTTAAVLAAKFYAKLGLKTCLLVQSQDPTAEILLGQKLGGNPSPIGNGILQALRLDSTKTLLEPLVRLKKADSSLNLSQGVLQEVVGEELGVLPGMDSIFAVAELEKLTKISGGIKIKNPATQPRSSDFDVVVYDGISSEETLRMIGAAERSRWYLRYLRNLAEKTDLGRLTAPSLLRLAEASLKTENPSGSNGQSSSEIWDAIETALKNGSLAVSNPLKFACYVVMDSCHSISLKAALRYWGCAIQAGAHVEGAFCKKASSSESMNEEIRESFSQLKTTSMPFLAMDSVIDWDTALDNLSPEVKQLLKGSGIKESSFSPVAFDPKKKMIILFLPGFDKSEIKLSQWKGGSVLLVEAGDQRRNITLPSNMRGKVSSARFDKSYLYVTLK